MIGLGHYLAVPATPFASSEVEKLFRAKPRIERVWIGTARRGVSTSLDTNGVSLDTNGVSLDTSGDSIGTNGEAA